MYDKSHLRTARAYQQFVRIPLKLALAHHWLVGMRGGEKVLESLAELFRRVPIYTLVASRPESMEGCETCVELLPLQQLPGAILLYKTLLPLFPFCDFTAEG